MTRSDPIVFISWALFLLYDSDTGVFVIYRTTQSGMWFTSYDGHYSLKSL